MKRKITILSAAFMLLAFLALPMGMRGQTRTEVTWTASEQGYENAQSLDGISIDLDDNITIQFDKNDGGTAPAYYNTGSAARMYPKNSLTVTPASGYQITGMTLTFSATGNTGTLGASVGTYSLSSTTGTWSGNSTEAVVLTNNATSGHARLQVLSVTYSDGTTPVPTTYTVTYDCNGGTSGCPENVTNIEPGTQIQLADAPSRDNYDFDGWSDGANIYGENEDYTVNGNVTFIAQWTEQSSGDVQWILTNLADLTENDVFVIVGNNGSTYAMSNDKGTSGAPITVAVTVENDAITGTVAANIQWTVSGNATNGYTFYPNGSTTTWLYCNTNANSGSNNNIRVGTGDRKVFELNSNNYLITKDDNTVRYLSIYDNADWRGYINTNLCPTMSFYKKVTGGVVPPSITAENVNITYNAEAGNIQYEIVNPVEGASIQALLADGATITNFELGEPADGTVHFTCDANATNASKTATVTLNYKNGDEILATKDVTVTQAANPNVFNNISDINAVGSQYHVKGQVVATNAKGFVIGDGTGYVYTYLNAVPTYTVGNLVDISGTTGQYGNIIQFTNTATLTEATETGYDGNPAYTVITEVPDYSQGYHLSTYLQFEGLLTKTDNYYYVAVGESSICMSYPTEGQATTLTDLLDKTVRVKGYFAGISSTTGFTVMMESIEDITPAVPSITVTPATVNLDAEQHYMNLLDLTYENIEVEGVDSFTVHYYNAEGEEIELVQGEAWLIAGVVLQDDVYQVLFVVVANYGEARTAYFKVSCGETYSNLVTVTQAAPVLDYAVLPFVWEGGERSAFEALNGTSTYGVGDYAATQGVYRMKLDSDGDYIMVKTDGQPGTVTIGVKMVGGSDTSTITIQGSADGETFTDIEELTISGAQNDILTLETNNAFDANDRYVRMLFTKGSNVGVGPITIAKGTAPSINIAPANFDLEAVGDLNGMQVASGFVTYNNIDITQASDFHIQFYDAEGVEQEKPEWILGAAVSQIANSYQVACMVGPNTGAARSTYYKIYAFDADSNPVYSNLVTINQAGVPQPSITITPDNFEVDANAHMVEYLTILAYENIVIVPESTENFGIQYCDAEGNPTEHSWCGVSVTAVENSDDFQLVLILATANTSNEARTAYFKVFGHDAEDNVVYSNLVTITQAAPVIDYAVLPFEWAGGASADFLALNGVTAYNLGSDYATGNAPYLIKFDGTGDYIQVKCDQQPGKVTIGVKMIGGGNTSNITIQGSADGETFTDIETLTISGASNDILTLETTNAFDDNDRYVRMVFTKGSNVGVGPITIEKGNAPSITVTPSTVDLEAAGQVGGTGYQMQSLTVTYNNLEITQASDFAVQFYDAEGEEQTQPSWIEPDPTVVSGDNDLGYMVMLLIAPNEGPARSAYFKVSALDADSNPVYSNLVTINQAAPNYATLPFEFNGGKNDIDNTIGLTYEGLGSDYNATSNPTTKLKFDSTDDCLILKLNEAPTSLSYDIKGNNFDGSTFTVQTSADGETYFDLATYGNAQLASGSLTSITHLDLASDVRYIKWIYTNKSGGNVGLGNIHASADYDIYGNVTVANLTIPANKTCTIYNGAVLNVTGTLTNEATENAWEHLVIKDGAQLKTPNEVKGTVEKNITGYGTTGKDNYVLLASPATIDACNSTGMWYHGQHADVDFYYFDQSREGEEWRNFKYGNTIFTGPYCMQQGQGFLYADKNDNTLTLQTRGYVAPNVDYQEHPFAPTNTPISVGVSYTAGKLFSGFNLVGNPFTCTAYLADGRDFYRMNANGNAIVLAEDNAINVCEGVFVVTTAAENTVTFTTAVPATAVNGGNIDLSLTQNHGALIDNARIRFGEGAAMPKMVFGGNSRIYFAQGNQDYAVVRSNAQGEMPVNFKAENNGTYTLSIDSKNVEMNYLHLIDNITGADVDLLAEPSYSFEARTSDYASRFRLVFSANSNVEDNSEASFAYYNGSEWVLNNMGNATLQVIDITGRVLSSETISGNASISLNQTPGVYMLRLINSDSVRTQKIVVK